jgi:hypothetical protein
LSSTAGGSGASNVTQNENLSPAGPNMSLDIEQNQHAADGSPTSTGNDAAFTQTNQLSAVAYTPPAGTVSQTQSSTGGGIFAKVNQDANGLSTANAKQSETQCEDAYAQPSVPTSCSTGEYVPPALASLTQTQHGPVQKAPGDSSQTGNSSCSPSCDSFLVNQSSQQDSDSGSTQTNYVSGGFSTTGTGTVNQTTNVDGTTTTSTESGQNVSSTTSCTGSTCTPTTPPTPTLTQTPSNPSDSSSATFGFTDSDTSANFVCTLDSTPAGACTSPTTYSNLADGSHTFSVVATDGHGNTSAPATFTWTIDVPTITQNGNQLTATNVDVAEFGYGGMRGAGTGSISVSGLSGIVSKALLYWNGPTNSTDPTSDATVMFNGNSVTGTNIGTASSNCWGFTNSQSYEVDVTPLVTGNGPYNLSDFMETDVADINGVSLIVFYNDGNVSNDRNFYAWSGNDSNIAFGTDPGGWNETISGVQYPGSGNASLDTVVSDGQGADDPALVAANTTTSTTTTLAPDGPIFQGDTTPAGAFVTSDGGDLWDVKSSFDITSLLTSGSNTLNITSAAPSGSPPNTPGWDCVSLVVAAANVPAAAQTILLTRTLGAPQRPTSPVPSARQPPLAKQPSGQVYAGGTIR